MSDPKQNHGVDPAKAFEEGLALAWRRLGASRSPIILAASGGADSTALVIGSAAVAQRLGLSLRVVSLDHGLRVEAAAEVEKVRALAAELGLPFDTRALGLSDGPGLEERARHARYEALEDLRQERGAAFVATAHTASDQAETLLMRLGRGASMRGAAAILERRGTLLRPLLFATRTQVRNWLTAQGKSWVDDPMNLDQAYLRVRVRQQVLPALAAAFDPRVEVRLARFSALALDDDTLLSNLADEAWDQVRLTDGNLSAQALTGAPAPLGRRWLARYLTERGVPLDFELVNDALNAVAEGRTQTLPGDQVLVTRVGVVRIEASAPRSKSSKQG